jgi:hypothetical protein
MRSFGRHETVVAFLARGNNPARCPTFTLSWRIRQRPASQQVRTQFHMLASADCIQLYVACVMGVFCLPAVWTISGRKQPTVARIYFRIDAPTPKCPDRSDCRDFLQRGECRVNSSSDTRSRSDYSRLTGAETKRSKQGCG